MVFAEVWRRTGIHIGVLGVFCLASPLWSEARLKSVQDGLAITADFGRIPLAPFLKFCPESSTPPAIDDAQCRSATEKENPANQMKIYKLPAWSFLTLKNGTAQDLFVVLEHELAITGRITLRDVSVPEGEEKVAGDAVSMSSRDYRAALPAFRLYLKANQTKTWRISIASDIVTRPGFILYSERTYFEATQRSNLIHAFYYGLIVSMIFYNFLLFLRLRDRLYLFYIAFISSLAMIYLGLFGQGFAFVWPDFFFLQKYGHDIFKFTAALAGIASFSHLLNVFERMPRLGSLVRWLYLAIAAAAISASFLAATGFFIVSNMVVTVCIIYGVFVAILSLLGRLPFSIYYIVALLSLLSGATINLLMVAGALPSNDWTTYSVQYGTALETIFLSIALGDRFATLRDQNHDLQIRLLEEKKRIARDIHDVVGTEFQMRLIEIGSEGENQISQKLALGLRGTLNKIREFLFLLHTEEQLASNLEPNVRSHLRRLETTKKFTIRQFIRIVPGALSTTEAYHLERAVDEIISNIARHARANQIRFHLEIGEKGGFLCVADNGIGFDIRSTTKNIGLESLQYRAERLGGRLKIMSREGKGTAVALRYRRRS